MAELDTKWLEELQAQFRDQCAAIQEAIDEIRINMPDLADYLAEHIFIDPHGMTVRYTGKLKIAIEGLDADTETPET